ncbi:MAG: pyruvate dehydrogenase complex dihydrolipoamide acetyltransferase [Geminicoccaceae bacterium]
MTIDILMPALSPTMTEGNLAKWLKKEGDSIAAGEIIAEIETDKATMEVEAVDEGVLGRILVAEGSEGVAVNTKIAVLLEDGEDASAIDSAAAAPAAPRPAPEPVNTQAPEPAELATPAAPEDATVAAAAPKRRRGERLFASPVAKRLAALEGIDLNRLAGSGPHGRIIKRDVEAAIASGEAAGATPAATSDAAAAHAPAAAAAPATGPAASTERPHTEVPLNTMRKTIARRLTEAKQTIPHFYLTREVELDALLALRKQVNAQGDKRGYKLSVNDFVIKAAAFALKAVPDCNVLFAGDKIIRFDVVDISVAVAIDGGLITPVIQDVDRKSLSTLSNEMKALAAKAKDGKLQPHEYQGGGFSISNLGMYGIDFFQAVINSPQGAILAVGAGIEKPVVKDGAVQIATMMSATLSTDHRCIDGALGAQFLDAFKGFIEDPMSMLV